jgi:hypothetical protein
MKCCTKCNLFKDDSEFYIRKTGKLYSWCKDCTKQYAEENPSNTAKNPEWIAAYRLKNRDRLIANHRKSRANNLPKRRNIEKKWAAKDRQENPGKYLVHQARARARKKGLPFNLEGTVDIPDFCPILNIPLFKGIKKHGPNSPSLDQIVAGNGYTKDNSQVISYKANTMKTDASPEELIRFANWVLKTYVKTLPD